MIFQHNSEPVVKDLPSSLLPSHRPTEEDCDVRGRVPKSYFYQEYRFFLDPNCFIISNSYSNSYSINTSEYTSWQKIHPSYENVHLLIKPLKDRYDIRSQLIAAVTFQTSNCQIYRDIGGQSGAVVTRPHGYHQDVGSNPATTRNAQFADPLQTPALKVPQ